MSVDRAAANLVQVLEGELTGNWTLPALHVGLGELVACIAELTGADPSLVQWRPDEAIESRFGRLPPLHTPRARAAGLQSDTDLRTLARVALGVIGEEMNRTMAR
jgi:hypothetical protein